MGIPVQQLKSIWQWLIGVIAICLCLVLPSIASATVKHGTLRVKQPTPATLAYTFIPATESTNTTIIKIAGGPGQPSTPFAGDTRDLLGTTNRKHYNVLTVDARGTGRYATVCKTLQRDSDWKPSEVRACVKQLGTSAQSMSTQVNVRDIERVRRHLKLDKVIPYGTSYGTQVAMQYAAEYPQHVNKIILDSPLTMSGDLWLTARLTYAADVMIRLEPNNPGITAAWNTVIARTQQAKPPVAAADIAYLSINAATDHLLQVRLPGMILAASHGNWKPLQWLVSQYVGDSDGGDAGTFSNTAYLATMCNDQRVPWRQADSRTTRLEKLRAYAQTRPQAGAFRASIALQVGPLSNCIDWRRAGADALRLRPIPHVPLLVVSGALDSNTPAEDAAAIAAQSSQGQLLTVPYVGHAVLGVDESDCSRNGLNQFLSDQPLKPCQFDGIDIPIAWAETPATLQQTQPDAARGLSAELVAVKWAMTDAAWLVNNNTGFLVGGAARARGPWGGSFRMTSTNQSTTVILKRFASVNDVMVSGTLSVANEADVTGTVTVTGAVTGTLTLKRGAISGMLDGQSVGPVRWYPDLDNARIPDPSYPADVL